jgi:hypothetical protein
MLVFGRLFRVSSLPFILICSLLVGDALASLGDRLPDFKECVKVTSWLVYLPMTRGSNVP